MLELESPRRITSEAILVPPQSQINLKTNFLEATFKLAPETTNDVMRVSEEGLLETGDALGRGLIVASVHDQTLSIPIEVKNIQYVLASLELPSIKLRSVESTLPSGINLALRIDLYDNMGTKFSSNLQDVNTLKYALSRGDNVNLKVGQNFTVGVSISQRHILFVRFLIDFINKNCSWIYLVKLRQCWPSL